MTYDVAFVDAKPDPDDPVTGNCYAMARRHTAGYDRLGQCELVDCADLRLGGAGDTLDVGARWCEGDPHCSRAGDTGRWTTVEPTKSGADPVQHVIGPVVESFAAGEEPALSARRALSASEVRVAIDELARERGGVDLPLTADDGLLEAMVEGGALAPAPAGPDEEVDA